MLIVIIAITLVIVYMIRDNGDSIVLYSQEKGKGDHTPVSIGQQLIMHDGQWRFWSVQSSSETALKVTSTNQPHKIFLKFRGRIDNLPAAIGGLSSHENYIGIFNSGKIVNIEFIRLDAAEKEVAASKKQCILSGESRQICNQEYNL